MAAAGALVALLVLAVALRPSAGDGPDAEAAARTVAAASGVDLAEAAERAGAPEFTITPERRAMARLSRARVAVTNGGGRRPMVALTFDDGPGPLTMNVLAVLARLEATATFYVQGTMIERRPATLRAIAAGGHEIGVHGWNHGDLTGMDREEIAREVHDTRDLIREVAGVDPGTMRPAYGAVDRRVLALAAPARLVAVLWNVDTGDWRGVETEAIVRHVLENAEAGSIVLMHDGDERRRPTVRALPAIIAGLRAKGLEPVTVARLLSEDPPAELRDRPAAAAPGATTDGEELSAPGPGPSSSAGEPGAGE